MLSRHTHQNFRRRILCGVALTAIIAPLPVLAADIELEEVVVTARKRNETLIEVPMSINVLSADDIEKSDINSLADISSMTAGLTVRQNISVGSMAGRFSQGISFRGAQNGSGQYARDNTGSLFIDGAFVSGGTSSIDTQDVERIEVLKGPQNAYFGRNTFAGAINFITRNPGDTFKGSIEASGSDRKSYDLLGSVEGPLIEGKLTGRLSGKLNERGSTYTATDGGKLGEQSDKSINATLYATPSDKLWLRVRGRYQYSEDGPDDSTFLRGTAFGNLCPGQTFPGTTANGTPVSYAVSRPYFCGEIPTLGQLRSRTGQNIVSSNTSLMTPVFTTIGKPTLFRDMLNNIYNNPLLSQVPHLDHLGLIGKIYRIGGQGEYTFDNDITVSFNAGYANYRLVNANDHDRTDSDNGFNVTAQKIHDFSSELRVTSPQKQRFRWLVGANYTMAQQQQQMQQYSINTTVGAALPLNGVVNAYNKDVGKVPAGFGAVEYDIFDPLTASAEIRYQQDKSTITGATTSLSVVSKDWLPRFMLRYKFSENSSIYASWAKGVMPGVPNSGFVTASPSQQAEIRAVFPDAGTVAPLPVTKAIEVGLKQRLFDGRIQYSLAAYHMKWDNINSTVTTQVSTAPFTLSIIRPASATLKGLEFEGEMAITQDWSAKVVVDMKRDKYKTFFNATISNLTSGVTNFNGNTIPRDPEFTASISSQYRHALNATWDWYLRGEANYTGKQYESEANIGYFGAYWRANARLGVERDDLFIELFANNLFNDTHWNSGLRALSTAEPGSRLNVLYNGAITTVHGLLVSSPSPREVGIRARYKF